MQFCDEFSLGGFNMFNMENCNLDASMLDLNVTLTVTIPVEQIRWVFDDLDLIDDLLQ